MPMNGMHPPARVEATQRWGSSQNSDSDSDSGCSNIAIYERTIIPLRIRPDQLAKTIYRRPITAQSVAIPLPPNTRPVRLQTKPKAPLQARPHDRRPTTVEDSDIENDDPLQTHPKGWILIIDDSDDSESQRDRRPLDEDETTSNDQPRTNGANGTYVGGVTQLSSQNRPQHPYAQHGRGPSESSANMDPSSATSSDWNTGGAGMTYGSHPYVRDPRSSSFGASGPLLRSPQIYQGGGVYDDYKPKVMFNLGSIPPRGRDNGLDSFANTPLFYSNSGQSPSNTTNPPISASNHNFAFAKIKVFHSSTDQPIAIRVTPGIMLRQLMKRVRERLRVDVQVLKYHGRMADFPGVWLDILDDVDLKSWMASADKLVLYAE